MFATLLQLQITPGTDILAQLTSSSLFTDLLKILFIICAILYVIFSFVVLRQITLMKQTVVTSLSGLLQTLGYIHLLFAIGVVIIFFLVL